MVTLNPSVVKQVFGSIDWGFTNPGVLQVWAMDGDGRLYRVYEIYQSQRTIDWWITRAKEVQAHFKVEAFVADPSEPAYIQQFHEAGIPIIPAINDVGPGIQTIQQRLRVQPDGRARIYFLRDATDGRDPLLAERKKPCSTEEEFLGYAWNEKGTRKKGEEPVKENDHGLDAARYLCATLDIPQAQAGGGAAAGESRDAGWLAWGR
jgi:hypothetical protein